MPDDLLHRQRRTTTGVTVDLGEDHAVEPDRLVERGRDVHRFLTGHRVDDEQRVGRVHRVAHAPQLVHQVGVDLQPTGGVHDHQVLAEARRLVERRARDLDRVLRPVVGRGPHREVELAAEHAQLLDRGRALQVGGDEQHAEALALEHPRELPGGGRLSGALQAREHHDRRRLRAHLELAGHPAERVDELLVHDLDDLLRRGSGSSGRPRRSRAP